MIRLSTEARNLNWLVTNFVAGVPGVEQAAVVSSDGLLIAMSEGLDRIAADRLSAWAEAVQIAGFSEGEADRFFGRPPADERAGLVIRLRAPAEVRADYVARHRALLEAC